MSRILTNEYTYIYCSTRRSKAPAIARPKGARALQLYLYSPPLSLQIDHFQHLIPKSTQFTQKCLKIHDFFVAKNIKIKINKKVLQFFKNPYK